MTELPRFDRDDLIPGGLILAVLTVRNLSDEVYRAQPTQAAIHSCSTEVEARKNSASSVKALQTIPTGDSLAGVGRNADLTTEDFLVLEDTRNKKPAEPMGFE
jgi:plasmid stability protein